MRIFDSLGKLGFVYSFRDQRSKNSGFDYPVGEGLLGVKIHFVHYKAFADSLAKWKERCERLNADNMAVMLTNWGGDVSVLERFDKLPFKNKVRLLIKIILSLNLLVI